MTIQKVWHDICILYSEGHSDVPATILTETNSSLCCANNETVARYDNRPIKTKMTSMVHQNHL